MTDGGGKYASLMILIRPDAHLRLTVGLADRLSQRSCRREQVGNMIKFPFGNIPPRSKTLHYRMLGSNIFNAKRIMRTVPRRSHSAKLKPSVTADAITVHGTVDQHGRRTSPVRRQDHLGPLGVGNAGKAFIMNHHVESLGPIGILVKWYLSVRGAATLLDHGPLDVGALRKPFRYDQFLTIIIMATTTRDE